MNEKSIKILKGFIFLAKLAAVVFGIGISALTTNSIFDYVEKYNPQEVIRKEYGDCAFSMMKHLYLMESCIHISTIKMVSFTFFM